MKYIILLLLVILSMNMYANENSKAPPGMSEEEWQKHQELNKIFEEEEKLKYEKELKENPPIPPWLKYPNYSKLDMFWSMGTGETYLMKYIYPYFKYASSKEIEEYKKKYPEPKGWEGWYEQKSN